jgi:hypothetical protein
MGLRFSAMVAVVAGLVLAAAGCGDTSDVVSNPGSASAAAAGAPGFGAANQRLCTSTTAGKPGYANTIGTLSVAPKR